MNPQLSEQEAVVNIGVFACSGSGLAVLNQPCKSYHAMYDSDLDA